MTTFDCFETQKNSRLSVQNSRSICTPNMVFYCLNCPITFANSHSGLLHMRCWFVFCAYRTCSFVGNVFDLRFGPFLLVSMIDLRIRSTHKRRMCSCPHLKDFKKADGLKVFRKVHAHFVCCGSREARKRKVHRL